MKSTRDDANNLNASASVHQYIGLQEDAENYGQFNLSLGMQLSDKKSLSFNQSLTAFEVVNPGYYDTQFSDTGILFRQIFPSLDSIPDLELAMTLGATLPTSQESQTFEVISKPQVGLSATRPISSYFSVSGNLGLRYYFNRYKTTPTEEGDEGGIALRQADVSTNLGFTIRQNEKLSFRGKAGWDWIRYEEIGQINTAESSAGTNHRPANHYNWDIAFNYNLYEFWSFELGYAQSDFVERSGGIQIVAFDPYQTRAYAGTKFTF